MAPLVIQDLSLVQAPATGRLGGPCELAAKSLPVLDSVNDGAQISAPDIIRGK